MCERGRGLVVGAHNPSAASELNNLVPSRKSGIHIPLLISMRNMASTLPWKLFAVLKVNIQTYGFHTAFPGAVSLTEKASISFHNGLYAGGSEQTQPL